MKKNKSSSLKDLLKRVGNFSSNKFISKVKLAQLKFKEILNSDSIIFLQPSVFDIPKIKGPELKISLNFNWANLKLEINLAEENPPIVLIVFLLTMIYFFSF